MRYPFRSLAVVLTAFATLTTITPSRAQGIAHAITLNYATKEFKYGVLKADKTTVGAKGVGKRISIPAHTPVTMIVTNINTLIYAVKISGAAESFFTTAPASIQTGILKETEAKAATDKAKPGVSSSIAELLPPGQIQTFMIGTLSDTRPYEIARDKFDTDAAALFKASRVGQLLNLAASADGSLADTIKASSREIVKDAFSVASPQLPSAVDNPAVIKENGDELYARVIADYSSLTDKFNKLTASQEKNILGLLKLAPANTDLLKAQEKIVEDAYKAEFAARTETYGAIKASKKDLDDTFTSAAKLYASIDNLSLFTVSNGPTQITGDVFKYTIEITRKGEEKPTPEKIEFTIRVTDQWAINFSTGLFLHNLVDSHYALVRPVTSTTGTPPVTTITSTLALGPQDRAQTAVGSLLHVYYKDRFFGSFIQPALSLGGDRCKDGSGPLLSGRQSDPWGRSPSGFHVRSDDGQGEPS